MTPTVALGLSATAFNAGGAARRRKAPAFELQGAQLVNRSPSPAAGFAKGAGGAYFSRRHLPPAAPLRPTLSPKH
ncbi:MAG: hypothetical protein ACLR17_18910 [Enterobacteriaceae bacterium]